MAKTIKVKSGDTLSKIAKATGTTVSAIASANKIKDINKISAGQTLSIPTSNGTKVTTSSSNKKQTYNNKTQSENPFFPNYVAPSSKKSTITTPTKKTPVASSGKSYNQYSISKPSEGTISTSKKKTGLAGFIDSINTMGSKLKGSLLATAYKSGYAENPYTYNNGLLTDTPVIDKPFSQISEDIKNIYDTATYNAPKEIFSGNVPKASAADTSSDTPSYLDASGNIYSDKSGIPIIASNTTVSPLEPDKTSATTTKSTLSAIESPTDSKSSISSTSSDSTESPTPTTNYNANKILTDTLMSASDSINTTKANPWDKYSKNGEVLKIADTSISNAVKGYNTPAEFTNAYNTDPGVRQAVDTIMEKTGKKLTDFTNKIEVVTNGITRPQTTAEFLANNANIDKEQTKLLNEEIALTNNFTQKQYDMYFGNDTQKGMLEKMVEEKNAAIDFYEEQEAKQEKSLKERANYEIDKAEAEYEKSDAEIELNRIKAKSNLTEFLAQIGALRTDGNALTGLETLEQAYQSQRQQLKTNYKLAVREIKMNLNDKIFDLETKRDERVFELNQDLSKSEKEIAMEVMKLDYNLQKDMLDIKGKYSDSIRTAKEKAQDRALTIANNNAELMYKIMSSGGTYEEAASLVSGGKFKSDKESMTKVTSILSKKAETEPKYTGETLTLNKSNSKKIMDKTGLIESDLNQIQKDLNSGWSLEQIAKNEGMPTSIYNVLKSYVKTQ